MGLWLNSLVYWHWLGIAALLLILELLLASGGFLLWIAIAAGVLGLVLWLWPGMGWPLQICLFSVSAISSSLLWWWYLQRNPLKTDNPTLNRRSEQTIGRIVTLQEPIANGQGKVRLDDSMWRVEGDDMPAGTQVRIVGIEGVILRVEKVKEHD